MTAWAQNLGLDTLALSPSLRANLGLGGLEELPAGDATTVSLGPGFAPHTWNLPAYRLELANVRRYSHAQMAAMDVPTATNGTIYVWQALGRALDALNLNPAVQPQFRDTWARGARDQLAFFTPIYHLVFATGAPLPRDWFGGAWVTSMDRLPPACLAPDLVGTSPGVSLGFGAWPDVTPLGVGYVQGYPGHQTDVPWNVGKLLVNEGHGTGFNWGRATAIEPCTIDVYPAGEALWQLAQDVATALDAVSPEVLLRATVGAAIVANLATCREFGLDASLPNLRAQMELLDAQQIVRDAAAHQADAATFYTVAGTAAGLAVASGNAFAAGAGLVVMGALAIDRMFGGAAGETNRIRYPDRYGRPRPVMETVSIRPDPTEGTPGLGPVPRAPAADPQPGAWEDLGTLGQGGVVVTGAGLAYVAGKALLRARKRGPR